MSQDSSWYDIYFLNTWVRGGRKYPFLDCWGLICDAYKRRKNITLDAYTQFTESSMTDGMIQAKHRFLKIDKHSELKELDVVCWIVGKHLRHVGIVVESNSVLHCDRLRGTCINAIDDIISDVEIYRYKGGNK